MKKLCIYLKALMFLFFSPFVFSDQLVSSKNGEVLNSNEDYSLKKLSKKDFISTGNTKLPSLEKYNRKNIFAKLNTSKKGFVSIKNMVNNKPLAEFTGSDGRLKLWLKKQGEFPKAIFISNGYVTIDILKKSIPKKYFVETESGVFHVSLPILVEHDATFHLDKSVKELRMSMQKGSFIVNDGKLFVTDTTISAWDDKRNTYAKYKNVGEYNFRPFINSWGGTETYFINSTFHSLGYEESKSYGISISQYPPAKKKKMKRGMPSAWILDSKFIDVWYGFYCYEAKDVVLANNIYEKNIIYGIDPHDRSYNLIIYNNTVYGTLKKHGIIISREVDHSWIINNTSFNNGLSGIVIDRQSAHNTIMFNKVYKNKSDGITVYESSNNIIKKNVVALNKRHGIRVRNSMNLEIVENEVLSNKLKGIYGHTKDLSNTDRNFKLDPYSQKLSFVVTGGVIADNTNGAIYVNSADYIGLKDINLYGKNNKSLFSGILNDFEASILNQLINLNNSVVVQSKEL